MNVGNAVTPTPDQIKEMSEPGHDRPIYMVNLLKFKEKAEYEDGRETEMTGQEAYSLYGARARVSRADPSHSGRFDTLSPSESGACSSYPPLFVHLFFPLPRHFLTV